MTDPSLTALLEDHPDIWMFDGEPAVRGTTIFVRTVVTVLDEGRGAARDHLRIRDDQIDAALNFALAEWLIHDRAAQEEEGQAGGQEDWNGRTHASQLASDLVNTHGQQIIDAMERGDLTIENISSAFTATLRDELDEIWPDPEKT